MHAHAKSMTLFDGAINGALQSTAGLLIGRNVHMRYAVGSGEG